MELRYDEIIAIKEAAQKKATGQRKWLPLIKQIIQEKREMGFSFIDITKKLNAEGLDISPRMLRQAVWKAEKRAETKLKKYNKRPSSNLGSKTANSSDQSGKREYPKQDLSRKLEIMEREERWKEAGFDKLKDL